MAHKILWMSRWALIVSLLAVSAPAQAQSAGPQYIVQSGDTLYAIALRFGVTLEALQTANPDINPDALAIGQALTLPGYDNVRGTLNTHPLEPGETLESLALRLGLRRETLIQLNRIVNPQQLYLTEPVVMVDEADAGAAVPEGDMRTLAPASGLLTFAAQHNQNPWALAAVNRLAQWSALPAETMLALPGGARALKALPWPLRDVQVGPLPTQQGRTLVVHVLTEAPLELQGALGEWPLQFNRDPSDPLSYYALLGIYRLADPNLYPFTVQGTDANGQAIAFSQAMPVRAADYGVDPPLTVDPATLDPANTAPELEQIRAIVSTVIPERYWNAVFAFPSVGAIRSRFGSLRSYNGGPYDSFHGGVDFSGGEDRPITAPAPGVVVFTGALTVRGNATLINHGWGVYTGYWHQSSILVQEGQQVSTGDVIGYQGSTGRVTGPHLHWEVWVGGVQVNGLEWTELAFP